MDNHSLAVVASAAGRLHAAYVPGCPTEYLSRELDDLKLALASLDAQARSIPSPRMSSEGEAPAR